MISLDKPDSRGEQGPGEIKMRSGFSARIWSRVIWSLRCTCNSTLHLAQILDDVVGERIVVIDDQHHFVCDTLALLCQRDERILARRNPAAIVGRPV